MAMDAHITFDMQGSIGLYIKHDTGINKIKLSEVINWTVSKMRSVKKTGGSGTPN